MNSNYATTTTYIIPSGSSVSSIPMGSPGQILTTNNGIWTTYISPTETCIYVKKYANTGTMAFAHNPTNGEEYYLGMFYE